jgi:hypothetical protein
MRAVFDPCIHFLPGASILFLKFLRFFFQRFFGGLITGHFFSPVFSVPSSIALT